MRNTGKSSEQLFEAYFASRGKRAFAYRMKDAAYLRGINGGKHVEAPAMPCDYICVDAGGVFLAEVKSCWNPTRFPFSQIETEQWGTAARTAAAGGRYIFYLHSLKVDLWFAVPASVVVNHAAKSLNWFDLAEYEWREMTAFAQQIGDA